MSGGEEGGERSGGCGGWESVEGMKEGGELVGEGGGRELHVMKMVVMMMMKKKKKKKKGEGREKGERENIILLTVESLETLV